MTLRPQLSLRGNTLLSHLCPSPQLLVGWVLISDFLVCILFRGLNLHFQPTVYLCNCAADSSHWHSLRNKASRFPSNLCLPLSALPWPTTSFPIVWAPEPQKTSVKHSRTQVDVHAQRLLCVPRGGWCSLSPDAQHLNSSTLQTNKCTASRSAFLGNNSVSRKFWGLFLF